MSPNSPESGVGNALAHGEFVHAYQPIFDLNDDKVTSVESLIRWQHPTRGLLTPFHFLDQIHQQDLSTELTATTLANVAADLPTLLDFYGADLQVAVNFSSEQLGDPRTLELVDEALARRDFEARQLVVEVVEDLRSEHMELSEQTILGLRARSIKVVLDDFGTGAGTLSLLTDLTYDGLKIDRHFVSRVRHRGPARSVVEVMLTFSRENNVVVVAEGVEDEPTLQELREMGCRFAQGYHLARPALLEDLTVPGPATGVTAPPSSPIDLDEWRSKIERRVPLRPNVDEADLVNLIAPIEAELAALAPGASEELRVDLGFRKMLAALYGGCNALAVEWGIVTSRLAEEHGWLGRSATILSVVAGITPDPTADLAPSAEALARALTLRFSTTLTPTEMTTIDNNLGVTLSSYGLIKQAHSWWESALSHGEDCRSRPLAALNLAEACLDRLNASPWTEPSPTPSLDRETVADAQAALRSSRFTSPGFSESIRARVAILDGDINTASDALYGYALDLDGVSQFTMRASRTVLAQARGDHGEFLDLSAELLKSVDNHHALRFQAVRASWIRVDALIANGLFEPAYELQRAMTLEERDNADRYITSFFDWMRLVVDVDRRFSELSDLEAPRPN